MSKFSDVPKLDIYEGARKWGEARLTPKAVDNTIHVELKREGGEWKPFLTFLAVDGRIAFRPEGKPDGKVYIYDNATGHLSDFVSQA